MREGFDVGHRATLQPLAIRQEPDHGNTPRIEALEKQRARFPPIALTSVGPGVDERTKKRRRRGFRSVSTLDDVSLITLIVQCVDFIDSSQDLR